MIAFGAFPLYAAILHTDDFDGDASSWVGEGVTPTIVNGKLEIDASSGGAGTIWFNQKLSGNVRIEYDVEMLGTNDLNCFWMATDPANPGDFFAADRSSGTFTLYDSLDLYYMGFGGNGNTTTRGRKYFDNQKPILVEYTTQPNLLNGANSTYRVRLVQNNGVVEYWIDQNDGNGMQKIWSYDDNNDANANGAPYTEGYFGIRGYDTRYRIDNVVIESLGADEATSTLVYEDGSGSLAYGTYANRGQTNAVNAVPDFSNAGYKGGGVPIPFVPTAVTIAAPTGGDDTTLIQNAIDTVAAMPLDANGFRGAVLIKAGNYQVSETILVRDSGIVIRGEGSQVSGGTTITFTATVKDDLFDVRGSGSPSEVGGTRVPITDAFVPTGSTTLNVSDASGYSVGDAIIVHYKTNESWISELGMGTLSQTDSADTDWTAAAYQLRYERTITEISGNTITIDTPLVQSIKDLYGGADIYKYTFANRISNVGIEGLRLLSTYTSNNDEDHGWSAILLNDLRDSWVRQVTVKYFGFAAVYVGDDCYGLTIEDCAMVDPKSVTDGGRKYSFNIDRSSNVLFQRCYTWGGRHDYVSGSKVSGPNVFVDSLAENTFSDIGPHHRYATGQLYDNVKGGMIHVQNRLNGGTGHGWAGAQIMFWNCNAPSLICDAPPAAMNWAVGCIGSKNEGLMVPNEPFGIWESLGTHVTPRSLYFRQLHERLGGSAMRNVLIPEQEAGQIWTALSAWAGDGLFGDEVAVWASPALPTPPNNTVALSGRVRNLNMLERGLTSTTWSKLSGPGTVAFGDASAMETTASFSSEGRYVLRLTVSDGVRTVTQDLTVRYGNNAPTVTVGGGQTAQLSADGWSPAEITTRGWYDAADTTASSIVATGNDLTTLKDKSGNGRDLASTGTGTAAKTGTDTINGRNVIRFDGTARYLQRSNFPVNSSGNLAIFTVAQILSVNSQYQTLVAMTNTNEFQFQAGNNSAFNGKIVPSASVGATTSLTGGPFPGTSTYGLIFDKTSGLFNAFIDGTKRTSDAAYNTRLSTSQTFRINTNRSNNLFLNSRIGEVILTDDVSLETRQKIEGYLAHKWGTTAALPSNHPYKTDFGGIATVTLTGTVNDVDNDPLETIWSVVSGPGIVQFSDANAPNATANFDTAGIYTLRLTADDGVAQTSQDWVVTVTDPGDISAPEVVSTLPADDAPAVPVDSNLQITFNEDIAFGSGQITLRRSSNDSLVAAYDVSNPGSNLLISGATLTIDPTTDLEYETGYYVTIADTAIEDTSGNAFVGISGSGTWNFTSDSEPTPPVVTYDANGATAGSAPVDANSPYLLGASVTVLDHGDLVRAGYLFTDWNTSADGSGTSYAAGNSFNITVDTTLYAQWFNPNTPQTLSSAATSQDQIIGLRQDNASALGYYSDAANNLVGNTGSSATLTRESANLVLGFSLPTLPEGTTVDAATLKFEITSNRDTSDQNPSMDVYLLDVVNPDTSGTRFFYHGPADPNPSVALAGSTYLDAGTSDVSYADDLQDQSYVLSGNALTILQGIYGGDNIPERSEVFFRFNLNITADLANLNRYRIDMAANESALEITTTPPPVDATAPTLAGSDIVDDATGGPVLENTLVTYTVTFSEDIDASTVSASDFGNAGTAAVSIGAITETSAGVFIVAVTPSTAGSLQLQVNAGAVITDAIGNALDTTTVIVDDTTLTVKSAFVGWLEANNAAGVTFGGDANGDGTADGLAWLLGVSEPSNHASAHLPSAEASSSGLAMSFQMLNAASRGSATLQLQYSNDLGINDPWANHTVTVPETSSTVDGVDFVITPIEGTDLHHVQASVPESAAGANSRIFARLIGDLQEP